MVNYKYADLYKQDSIDKQMKIEYDGGTITNYDIHSEQFVLTENLCSELQLKFGSCEASSIEFKISNIETPLKDNVLTVSEAIGGNTDVHFSFGVYKVYSDVPTADRRYRQVKAYDLMYDIINAEVSDWYNKILPNDDSTVTLKQFRTSFIEYFGLQQESVTLVNDNMIVQKTIEPSSISGRDIITAICEINGCFGHIGRDGKFHYVFLPKSFDNVEQTPYISCNYEDFEVQPITKLQIRQEENDIGAIIGNGDNTYIIEDNFLIYGKSASDLKTIAQNVFSVIQGISYRPFSADIKGNPCTEVGDAIQIYDARNDKYINSYVLNRTLKGVQALRDSFTAQGEEKYIEQVNSVQRDIKQIRGKTNVLERTVEETKSTITDVEKNLQSEIKQTADEINLRIDEFSTQDFNLIRGTNIVTELTSKGLWENGTWRSASGGAGEQLSIDITDCPNPSVIKGWRITKTSGTLDISQDNVPVIYGQKYTISCYARLIDGNPYLHIQSWKSSSDAHSIQIEITDKEWKRYAFSFTHDFANYKDNTNIYFGIGNKGNGTIEICGMKLELGEVNADRTVWTPAIQDLIDGYVTEVEMQTAIQLAKDAITLEVSNTYTKKSEFTGLSSTVSQHTTQIQQNANQIALKVSQSDYNGETIASLINQTASTVLIQAKHIELDGDTTVKSGFVLSAEHLRIGTNGYSVNPNFSDWTGTYPFGISNWNVGGGISKFTLNGQNLIQMITGTVQTGVRTTNSSNSASFWNYNLNLNGVSYVAVEIKFRLTNGTNPSGAGALIDFYYLNSSGANTYARVTCPLTELGTNLTTNKWYTYKKVIQVPVSATDGQFNYLDGFLMGNYNANPGALGTLTSKTIQFASFNVYKATEQDYLTQTWTSGTYIDGNAILTKSIKADKIDVNDLFAQNITATGQIQASDFVVVNQIGFKTNTGKIEELVRGFDIKTVTKYTVDEKTLDSKIETIQGTYSINIGGFNATEVGIGGNGGIVEVGDFRSERIHSNYIYASGIGTDRLRIIIKNLEEEKLYNNVSENNEYAVNGGAVYNYIQGNVLKLSGGTMTGNIVYNMYNNTNKIPFKVWGGDVNGYGLGISVGAGGRTIIGAGESAQALEVVYADTPATEELDLAADSFIRFLVNCNNIDNRAEVALNASRYFYPMGAGTDGAGAIGTVNDKWAQAYINKIYGELTGTSTGIKTQYITTGTVTLADYRNPGIYCFNTSGGNLTITDMPEGVNGWLIVLPYRTDIDNPTVKQFWTRWGTATTNSFQTYERLVSGSTVGEWTRFATYARDMTSNRAVYYNGNHIATTDVTNTELGYVHGVTSSIQTQLNNKLDFSGGTLTGALTANANIVLNSSGQVASGNSNAVNGNEIYSYLTQHFQSGALEITPTGANQVTSVTVKFDRAFSKTPIVVASVASSVPNLCTIGTGSASSTQFTIYFTRTNTTTTPVRWFATDLY